MLQCTFLPQIGHWYSSKYELVVLGARPGPGKTAGAVEAYMYFDDTLIPDRDPRSPMLMMARHSFLATYRLN